MVSSVEIHLSKIEPKNGAIFAAPIQQEFHQGRRLLASHEDPCLVFERKVNLTRVSLVCILRKYTRMHTRERGVPRMHTSERGVHSAKGGEEREGTHWL